MQQAVKIGKRYYFIATVLFLLAVFWGFVTFHAQFTDGINLKDLFSGYSYFQQLPAYELFILIFLNNSTKALLAIILGTIFGIFPLYFIYINGMVLGATISFALARANALVAIAGLLPHGIFEIPALIIAIVYGLWLGVRFIFYLGRQESLKPAFQKAMSAYFRIILPLLLVGAIIEAFVTPVLLNAALNR